MFNDSGAANATAGFTFTKTSNLVTVAGNVQAGNLRTAGLISATGNVTGSYFLGNGSQLTGITTTPNAITNGTSNVSISSSGGNATVGIAGTNNIAVFHPSGLSVTSLISTPKTISSSLTVPSDVNAMLISAVTISDTGSISIPDAGTLQIIP